MDTPTTNTEARQDDVKTAPILDQLLHIENETRRILLTPGIRLSHPCACDELDVVLQAITRVYIKFNEGDDVE